MLLYEEHFDSINFQLRLMLSPATALMLTMAGVAICLIHRSRMTTATITHSAKVIFFWMLEPRMRTRITRPPIVDSVTFETVAAKRGSMPAWVSVTAHAGGGCAFKDHVLMAS